MKAVTKPNSRRGESILRIRLGIRQSEFDTVGGCWGRPGDSGPVHGALAAHRGLHIKLTRVAPAKGGLPTLAEVYRGDKG
jgi:hypothetical protein